MAFSNKFAVFGFKKQLYTDILSYGKVFVASHLKCNSKYLNLTQFSSMFVFNIG